MEKKGGRSGQPVSKGLVTDSKKNQDGASSKLWPRGGRPREPAGGSISAKSEASRKPNPPRTAKTFDKRPRPRGAPNPSSFPLDRTETTWLEHHDAELGSVFHPGSKKQSLNHLFFVYESPGETRNHPERGSNTNNRTLLSTRKHKYNKEQFLQANCQFIVNFNGDYKQYMNNPDALVDWNLIEQVNIQVSEFPSCPICLYPPVAAKMTRCGHIYCWPCVLHYLSLSDKTWRKCPICYESINQRDLKSVVTIPHNTFNVNDMITFKLMKRPKGSLVAYPATAHLKDEDTIFKLNEKAACDVYSKLLLANHEEILAIIRKEYGELERVLAENADCPENCFIEQALVLLKERKASVEDSLDAFNKKPDSLNNALEELQIGDAEEQSENGNISESIKCHYFYQASDGQHIYLHAINARMLEHTYGSLEHGPKTLTGRILEKEGGSMTEELRKRLRYLQHLPVTCQFEVAEIQLRQPLVNKETLEHFTEQVEIRRKKRQKRSREEKKREKRINEEQNRQMGKFPNHNLHLESQAQFPCFEPRNRTESECTPSDITSLSDEQLTPSNSLNMDNEYAGPSFAKMLGSSTKKEVTKWPALSGAITAPKLINVTGQKTNVVVARKQRNGSDSEPEIEVYETIAPPCNTMGDAIVQALQQKSGGDNDSGKKRKKRNKQKF